MNYIISKELLGEVLGENIEDIHIVDNQLLYSIPNYKTEEDGEEVYINLGARINIYELAHKCKEWVLQYDKELLSTQRKDRAVCDMYGIVSPNFSFYGENECEAIFKACQWIMDNANNN